MLATVFTVRVGKHNFNVIIIIIIIIITTTTIIMHGIPIPPTGMKTGKENFVLPLPSGLA